MEITQNLNRELKVKTIRMEESMIKQVEQMSLASERDFSAQVRFIIKEYIKLKENK